MQLPEEVLAAIRQGSRQAFEQDAVPMATWFPEFSAWAEKLDMKRALTDPVEERYHKIQFFLAEMEVHWYTLHVEPARVFSAKICADLGGLGASDLQWFGSFWYGLSMPDSDIDFMPLLSSSAKKDVPTFLRSLAAHLGREECKAFGFQEVSLNQ